MYFVRISLNSVFTEWKPGLKQKAIHDNLPSIWRGKHLLILPFAYGVIIILTKYAVISGRPMSASTPDNIEEINELISDAPRLSIDVTQQKFVNDEI